MKFWMYKKLNTYLKIQDLQGPPTEQVEVILKWLNPRHLSIEISDIIQGRISPIYMIIIVVLQLKKMYQSGKDLLGGGGVLFSWKSRKIWEV